MAKPALGSLESSEQLLRDLYVDLRQKINIWADITKQTAQARMGYVGQHLVSVVTGHPGGRSGARGKDLVLNNKEFAEIKTCYRIDQLSRCNACDARVSSIELECPVCGSTDIKRNDDSKWLIGIQHEEEFSEVLEPTFYYLVLFDFTDLTKPDTVRASIWRVNPLAPGFAFCMIDYYKNIKANSKSGAPFNLWPYSLKFYLMRPTLIYQSHIYSDDSIKTRLFPRKNPEEPEILPNLTSFSQSRNLTVAKVREFAEQLKIRIPDTGSKKTLLTAVQEKINRGDATIDALANILYREEINRHLPNLPQKITLNLKQAGLI